MNAEVIKAMNKTESKSIIKTMRNWWGKNGYKVVRVILFPVWVIAVAHSKYNAWANAQQVWDETRANEILNYYIPRSAEWDEKDKRFYFFDNGMGWRLRCNRKYINRKDRRFWTVNVSWFGGKIRDYLIEKFELEGFTKEVGNCWDGWTEITFTMKKED